MFSREERINRIITQGKKNWILRRRRENLNLPFETHAYAVRVNHTIMLIFHYFSRSKSESESIYPPSFLSLHRPSINYSNNFHARLPTTHGRPLFGLRGLVASLESSLFKLCRLVWADNSAITFQRIETVYLSSRRDDDCEFDWFGSEESRIIFGKNERIEKYFSPLDYLSRLIFIHAR